MSIASVLSKDGICGGRGKKGPVDVGYLQNNLTGMRFGCVLASGELCLEALAPKRHGCWECKCHACGHLTIVRAADLLAEKYKSCGCLSKQLRAKTMADKRESKPRVTRRSARKPKQKSELAWEEHYQRECQLDVERRERERKLAVLASLTPEERKRAEEQAEAEYERKLEAEWCRTQRGSQ